MCALPGWHGVEPSVQLGPDKLGLLGGAIEFVFLLGVKDEVRALPMYPGFLVHRQQRLSEWREGQVRNRFGRNGLDRNGWSGKTRAGHQHGDKHPGRRGVRESAHVATLSGCARKRKVAGAPSSPAAAGTHVFLDSEDKMRGRAVDEELSVGLSIPGTHAPDGTFTPLSLSVRWRADDRHLRLHCRPAGRAGLSLSPPFS